MIREKILLAGFSGSGKSTLLKELEQTAPDESWHFADLDQLVLKSRGKGAKTLAQVIERDGWDQFRRYERQELEGWLKEEGPGVLSLGGGTLSPLLWELYKSSRKVGICYLHASFEECWQRLQLDKEERPLVLLGKAALEKIYQERQLVFGQVPWKLENFENKPAKQLAAEFWELVFPS